MHQSTLQNAMAAISEIAAQQADLAKFWGNSKGWAPDDAAHMLTKSRLDRQAPLSSTLRLWVRKTGARNQEAYLILGWANLGALVESTMKMFLCIYLMNVRRSPSRPIRRGTPVEPDKMSFEEIRVFFQREVWANSDHLYGWGDWVEVVQQRRNAIHFLQDRCVGDIHEFRAAVVRYRDFLVDIDSRLPYPDFDRGLHGDV